MPAQITVQLPQIGVSPSRDRPGEFDDEAEDMMDKLPPLQQGMDQFSTQANALALDVNAMAQAAEQSAASAVQAALLAGAVVWVSGQSYALGSAAVDPITLYTYRKRTAASSSTTRPDLDQTNWKNISAVEPVAGNLVDSGATVTPIAWDAGAIKVPTLTLVGNRTIGAPTNLAPGNYVMHIKQDGTGGRTLSFDSVFVFPDDVPPQISPEPNYRTVFSYICDGVNLYASYMPGYKK